MLLDHFHSPLSDQRDWHGFHNAWATYISASLNHSLPDRWFAQPHVEFCVEIDVATLEESTEPTTSLSEATETPSQWAVAEPNLTLALPIIADVVEVQVFRASGGRTLVGAIELVSSANKDRAETREAFVAKSESLIGAGVGLLVVDMVTNRRANLHEELLDRLGHAVSKSDVYLYGSAYHPVQRGDRPCVDIWNEKLTIGQPLPTMPLFLRSGPCTPIDLNGTYRTTCVEQRIPTPDR